MSRQPRRGLEPPTTFEASSTRLGSKAGDQPTAEIALRYEAAALAAARRLSLHLPIDIVRSEDGLPSIAIRDAQ